MTRTPRRWWQRLHDWLTPHRTPAPDWTLTSLLDPGRPPDPGFQAERLSRPCSTGPPDLDHTPPDLDPDPPNGNVRLIPPPLPPSYQRPHP